MPTNVDRIQTAITQVTERIVEVTSSMKPSYTIDGESYSHSEYLAQLTASLVALQQSIQVLGNPFQKITRMKT